ncbi:MAG: redoxin domain-containing protein [Bacteroidales bacterium]|jgi:thiol-disulfide isomerase/thioredoxin|nr:redoxin domain-containing protein [Bacteroidales bacterium]
MKPFNLVILFLLICKFLPAQEIRITDFNGLKPLLDKRNDTTYVVNFWATWCSPCVKELPAFERVHADFSNRAVSVKLVSLDFRKQLETRLIPFVQKRNLKPEVILLDDPDSNAWIDKISPEWSGALPATLIYNRNFRAFYERGFTFEELAEIINQNMIKQ